VIFCIKKVIRNRIIIFWQKALLMQQN